MIELDWRPTDTAQQPFRPAMPVDFTSYLLASSPPGLDIFTLRERFNSPNREGLRQPLESPFTPKKVNPTSPGFNDFTDKDRQNEQNDDSPNCDGAVSVCKPLQGGSGKKRVCFADELGLALVQIRVMKEHSSTPPQLNLSVLAAVTKGLSPTVVEPTRLILNFNQPAADYLAFRERLDHNCVCLENVILKGKAMVGTIKVKNVAFEKTVFVRYTKSNWVTHTDLPAKYVANGQAGPVNKYDTFSFELTCDLQPHENLQFALCYRANNQEFWDNNDNCNYEVLPESKKAEDFTCPAFKKNATEPYSQFSSWTNHDLTVPYW